MLTKWFHRKPKPAPIPEVECPVTVGQHLKVVDGVVSEIVSIDAKSEWSDSWACQSKAIVGLPVTARNIRVIPVVSGKYGVTGYCVVYDFPNEREILIQFDNKYRYHYTDSYGRDLYVTAYINKVETN
ncbi:MAG TPA: hypothetical protein VMR19_00070 [Candidatus Saccharimonadales bacterium]|jgi:hypothetical protein|nr:hypothetical protein [Candidatus Saccharimonadales bacterium]